jgi:imidazole glycerol-phosphate synthase
LIFAGASLKLQRPSLDTLRVDKHRIPPSKHNTESVGSTGNMSSISSSISKKPFKVSILDYGAGNVRSVRNAVASLGYELEDISSAQQIADASVLIFPGVGAYGSAMRVLQEQGYDAAIKQYLANDKPFLGICLGMQTLFDASEEVLEDHTEATTAMIPGLGVVPGNVIKFDETAMSVPHMGWSGRKVHQRSPVFQYVSPQDLAYFVHSYYAPITDENKEWVLCSTTYSGQEFVSAVQRGNVVATQFHPEKSGETGLQFLRGFLEVRSNGARTGMREKLGIGRYRIRIVLGVDGRRGC